MFIDPRQLENDVQRAMVRDPRIARPDLIAVSVDELGTVTLRGVVDSTWHHRVASQVGRQVAGVFMVVNRLHVRPPAGRGRADEEPAGDALGIGRVARPQCANHANSVTTTHPGGR